MAKPVLARRVQRNLQDYGSWVTVKKILASLLSPVFTYRVYRIYKVDLKAAQPQEELNPHDITFQVLDANDKHVIEQIETLAEFLRGEVEDRIASGDLCLAALHGEQLAGFNLISFGKVFIPLIEQHRVFRQGEAWSVQIAVHKDFRRRGLGTQLRYRIFDELRKRGVKRLYGGTLRSNAANLKLSRKVGLLEFVDVHYVKVLNFRTWRYRRVRE